jgi:hypothetical protein
MDDEWGAGDPGKWSDHGFVMVGNKEYPLIYGEHPCSRSDNRHYVNMGHGDPVGFAGHRILIGVQIEMNNYLKSSELSGDEVRKGGSGKILANGEVVYEFFCRDPQRALLEAHHLIDALQEHSSGWLSKRERDGLIGRAVFYREVPAVIQRVILDQGCLMIATADGKPFPPPVYAESDDDDERESTVKVGVLDRNIWWFRQAKPADAPK